MSALYNTKAAVYIHITEFGLEWGALLYYSDIKRDGINVS